VRHPACSNNCPCIRTQRVSKINVSAPSPAAGAAHGVSTPQAPLTVCTMNERHVCQLHSFAIHARAAASRRSICHARRLPVSQSRPTWIMVIGSVRVRVARDAGGFSSHNAPSVRPVSIRGGSCVTQHLKALVGSMLVGASSSSALTGFRPVEDEHGPECDQHTADEAVAEAQPAAPRRWRSRQRSLDCPYAKADEAVLSSRGDRFRFGFGPDYVLTSVGFASDLAPGLRLPRFQKTNLPPTKTQKGGGV